MANNTGLYPAYGSIWEYQVHAPGKLWLQSGSVAPIVQLLEWPCGGNANVVRTGTGSYSLYAGQLFPEELNFTTSLVGSGSTALLYTAVPGFVGQAVTPFLPGTVTVTTASFTIVSGSTPAAADPTVPVIVRWDLQFNNGYQRQSGSILNPTGSIQ